ncbi:MAG: stage II sporulation protein M [Arenicella sp.]
MKQTEFIVQNQEFWEQLQRNIKSPDKMSAPDMAAFPNDYRKLCQQLSLAKNRSYSNGLIARLNAMVLTGHALLYKPVKQGRYQWFRFLYYGFPNAIRRNQSYVWIATAAFCLPLLLMGLACYFSDTVVYSLMSVRDVANFESMYDPANRVFGRERESTDNILMFGHYIKNNISISFQCFASGILLCVGSLFFLVFNGLYIGAVAGHLTNVGFTDTFYPFVVGHGSFELTAIVFSGAAGLKLGHALLVPGHLSRIDALKLAAKDAVKIIYGTTLMLIIAAFLEAFWSSQASLPVSTKYLVGGVLWALVIAYFLFLGNEKKRQGQ